MDTASERVKKWRLANPERVKELRRQASANEAYRYRTDPAFRERKLERGRLYHKRRRERDPEWAARKDRRFKEHMSRKRAMSPALTYRQARDTTYRRQYNVTLEQVEAVWQAQGGLCGICQTPLSLGTGKHAVDHDHATGRFRGMLCGRCNKGLGFVEPSGRIEQVIAYLANPPGEAVL